LLTQDSGRHPVIILARGYFRRSKTEPTYRPSILANVACGVIQRKGDGTVIGYNQMEASRSKLDPARVVWKNFFSRYLANGDPAR
jgi:hypothetical protein